MILCLDIGNSHIFGGVFDGDELRLKFRIASKMGTSSDEFGLFFCGVLRENGIDPKSITNISMCSVVPEVVYAISASCRKYFDQAPFILQAGVRTGLKIGYQNPQEVGADRIANAIAGTHLYPDQDLLIIDLGTATTLCAIGKGNQYKGGVILPGLRMSMQALEAGASKLGAVEIVRADKALGRTTAASIQSGLYFGSLGALKEVIGRVREEEFSGRAPKILATGGFAALFEPTGLFDINVPDLVLQGLKIAQSLNSVEP
jgi:type III pantothenate kinase